MLWMYQRIHTGWKQWNNELSWQMTAHLFWCPRAWTFPSAPNMRIACSFPIGLHQWWEHHIFYSTPRYLQDVTIIASIWASQSENVTEREGGKKGNLFICWFSAMCRCLLLVFMHSCQHSDTNICSAGCLFLSTHTDPGFQFHNITQDLNRYFIYKKQINSHFAIKDSVLGEPSERSNLPPHPIIFCLSIFPLVGGEGGSWLAQRLENWQYLWLWFSE